MTGAGGGGGGIAAAAAEGMSSGARRDVQLPALPPESPEVLDLALRALELCLEVQSMARTDPTNDVLQDCAHKALQYVTAEDGPREYLVQLGKQGRPGDVLRKIHKEFERAVAGERPRGGGDRAPRQVKDPWKDPGMTPAAFEREYGLTRAHIAALMKQTCAAGAFGAGSPARTLRELIASPAGKLGMARQGGGRKRSMSPEGRLCCFLLYMKLRAGTFHTLGHMVGLAHNTLSEDADHILDALYHVGRGDDPFNGWVRWPKDRCAQLRGTMASVDERAVAVMDGTEFAVKVHGPQHGRRQRVEYSGKKGFHSHQVSSPSTPGPAGPAAGRDSTARGTARRPRRRADGRPARGRPLRGRPWGFVITRGSSCTCPHSSMGVSRIAPCTVCCPCSGRTRKPSTSATRPDRGACWSSGMRFSTRGTTRTLRGLMSGGPRWRTTRRRTSAEMSTSSRSSEPAPASGTPVTRAAGTRRRDGRWGRRCAAPRD